MGHQYVSGNSRSPFKPHSIKSEEITALFVAVGWVGQRRVAVKFLKIAPLFDKGPGLGR